MVQKRIKRVVLMLTGARARVLPRKMNGVIDEGSHSDSSSKHEDDALSLILI